MGAPAFWDNGLLGMRPVEAIANDMASRSGGIGYERIEVIAGSTYKDNSTVVIIPTRGMIHHRVVQSWQGLISPMNQKRAMFFAVGDEVGHAYNRMIKRILDDPELSKWRYILTLEDDNVVPADAHVRLLESIEMEPKWDAVSGIYFTKGEVNMPMAYGSPDDFERTGVVDFRPRDIRECLAAGKVMPVNGIAMGCTLWRTELFRQIEPPWFVTVADVVEGKGVQGFTQDLYMCKRAREAGKRFAVDMRVRVGHLDVGTNVLY